MSETITIRISREAHKAAKARADSFGMKLHRFMEQAGLNYDPRMASTPPRRKSKRRPGV